MRIRSYIRILIAIVLTGLITTTANAQHFTDFNFVGESAPINIRRAMQDNAQAVFREINEAHFNNRKSIMLSTNNATNDAIEGIKALWSTSKFYCTEKEVKQSVLQMPANNNSVSKYQVRNVSVFFVDGATKEDQEQELVLEFTSNGKISDIYIALSKTQFPSGNVTDVTDTRRRQLILGFVENFRTAYNRKDIKYLEQVFSEDALIITGKVLKQSGDGLPNTIKVVQNKKGYMTNLKKAFEHNSFINVKFDEIKVFKTQRNSDVYVVTLRQKWNSSGYNDEGWLFLMIDFQNENEPLIWVRAWDPPDMPEINRTGEDDFIVQKKNK